MLMPRQGFVDRKDHSRNIFMNVGEPVRVRRVLELAMRRVHTEHGVAGLKILDQAGGHELADILLRLFVAAADVGCENHVGKILQRAGERAAAFGLVRKHVDCCAGKPPVLNIARERFVIHHKAPA